MRNGKFYLALLLIAASTSVIIAGLQFLGYSRLINPYIWFIQMYLVAVTAITYFVTVRGVKDKLMDFQNYVMASVAIRFFLSAIIIFLYIYLVKVEGLSFLVNFFILYLLYTGFEITSVLTNLRAYLKNGEK